MNVSGFINHQFKPHQLLGTLKEMGFSNPPEVGLQFVQRHRQLTKKYKGRKIAVGMNTRMICFVDVETGIIVGSIEEDNDEEEIVLQSGQIGNN